MTRIGINPARGKNSGFHPAHVTVAVLVYIPDLGGYFENRLQILQIVLASLNAYTAPPYDLLIFDNGSCSTVVDYLREMQAAGQIDYLLLSHKNIGKIDAFQIIFNAAPGDIVAYCDDDILFYPGWLEAHLEILDLFPHVGMVSGVPVRNAAGHARKSLDALIEGVTPGLTMSFEQRIPDAWEADWAISTGRDSDAHLIDTQDHLDLVIRLEIPRQESTCEAIGSANHFQFVTQKRVILQAMPKEWSGKLMGSMIELDEAIDDLGYLRLSTVDRYSRHLGNVLGEEVFCEVQRLGLLQGNVTPQQASSFTFVIKKRKGRQKHWLLSIPGSRRLMMAAYNRLFEILYR